MKYRNRIPAMENTKIIKHDDNAFENVERTTNNKTRTLLSFNVARDGFSTKRASYFQFQKETVIPPKSRNADLLSLRRWSRLVFRRRI